MASEDKDAHGCAQMKGGRRRTRTRMSVVPIGASRPWSKEGRSGCGHCARRFLGRWQKDD